MKRILLISAGLIHPPFLARWRLRRLLAQQPELFVRSVRSLEEIDDSFFDSSAWILYFHQKKISARALATLQKYVSEGGGILAIHSATASFKDCPAYFEILGGRFLTHGEVRRFELIPTEEDKLFADFERFEMRDELYLHQLDPQIQVHFFTQIDRESIPVVWSSSYGAGRVFYAMPGHCNASLNHPAYQRLLLRGLAWVSSGKKVEQ